jgi:hypothetical protein
MLRLKGQNQLEFVVFVLQVVSWMMKLMKLNDFLKKLMDN